MDIEDRGSFMLTKAYIAQSIPMDSDKPYGESFVEYRVLTLHCSAPTSSACKNWSISCMRSKESLLLLQVTRSLSGSKISSRIAVRVSHVPKMPYSLSLKVILRTKSTIRVRLPVFQPFRRN